MAKGKETRAHKWHTSQVNSSQESLVTDQEYGILDNSKQNKGKKAKKEKSMQKVVTPEPTERKAKSKSKVQEDGEIEDVEDGQVDLPKTSQLGKGRNKSKGKEASVMKSKSEKLTVTSAEVHMNNEIMDLQVTEQDEELLSNDEDSMPPLEGEVEEQEVSELGSEDELLSEATESGSEDAEVSFGNLNTSHRSSERRSRSIEPAREELIEDIRATKGSQQGQGNSDKYDAEELKSMEKFARFLEKSGYIQKASASRDTLIPPAVCNSTGRKQTSRKEATREREGRKTNDRGKSIKNQETIPAVEVTPCLSETTIYHNTVPMELDTNELTNKEQPELNKRTSSSSEEAALIDTSDELMDTSPSHNEFVGYESKQHETLSLSPNKEKILFKQFLEYRMQVKDKDDRSKDRSSQQSEGDRDRTREGQQRQDPVEPSTSAAHDRTQQMLQHAEASKARIYQVGGKCNDSGHEFENSNLYHSLIVDEHYTLIENHVDEVTKRKIASGEYVDLAKLLPHDKVLTQQDHRMEMINKNGHTYWIPASEKEVGSITSYGKWDQAFRVFSMIYVETHPAKAKELMQYNHMIYSASLSFVWDNVYAYDIDFRLHLSKYPERNWGIILSQAWTMRLKDRLTTQTSSSQDRSSPRDSSGPDQAQGGSHKRICWKYNQGLCTYGFRCKFDHRCGVCGKSGHGAHICRKLQGRKPTAANQPERRNASGAADDRKRN